MLFYALPVTVETTPGLEKGGGGESCIDAGQAGVEEVRLGFGKTRIEVAPGDDAALSMRRFGGPGEFPVGLPSAPGESTTVLTVPRDKAPNPWYLHVTADQAVRVCH